MMTGTATRFPFALGFSYDDADKANWSPNRHGVEWQQQNPHPLHDSGEKVQY